MGHEILARLARILAVTTLAGAAALVNVSAAGAATGSAPPSSPSGGYVPPSSTHKANAAPHLAANVVPPAPDPNPPSTVGTEFWTAFGANCPCSTETDYVFLSGATATTATVAMPGLSFSQDVSVVPGMITSVAVPQGDNVTTPDGIQQLAVHVTAGAPVSVYGLEDQPYSTDGFTALPVTAIGTDYYALGYDSNPPDSYPSDFQVVGTVNNTTVTITPSSSTAMETAGVPYTVTLNAGDVYQLIGNPGADLTGTHISSTQPVSVLAGSQCANIPNSNYVACNYVAEQMPPTPEWGRDFVTEPLATRTNGDTFRVLASQANTQVTLNGSVVATLGAGQFYQTQLITASVIHTSLPTLVAQYSDSQTFDGNSDSDPSETLVPPDEQFLNSYTVATAPDARFTNYLNVVAPTTSAGDISLDGSPIPASDFSAIGTSGFSGAQLPVSTGTHNLDAPVSFGVTAYGFSQYDAYSEPGGYAAGPVAEVTTLTLAPATQTLATGKQACLTAHVEDQHGNALAGVGVNFTVTGVNPTSGFASSNPSGNAQFCYTGTKGGNDTVTAVSGPAHASATVVWTSATTDTTALTYTGTTAAVYGQSFVASATLTDTSLSPDKAVAGEPLVFTLGTQSCTSSPTNAAGSGGCALIAPAPGSYTITVSFQGDTTSTPNYKASATATKIVVSKAPTTLTLSLPPRAQDDDPVTLGATLTGPGGVPVQNAPIVFTLGTEQPQSCTATTGANGFASCTIADLNQSDGNPLTSPVVATFAGDAFYLSSSATGTVPLVYYTGQASALTGTLLTTSVFDLADTGSQTRPDDLTNSVNTVDFTSALITGNALTASLTTKDGTSHALASVANLTIGVPLLPAIVLQGVDASSTSACLGATGGVTIASLAVGGRVLIGPGSGLGTAPPPNTTLSIGLVTIVLNQQLPVPGASQGLQVNGVHITIPGVANVIVSSARSDIHNCG